MKISKPISKPILKPRTNDLKQVIYVSYISVVRLNHWGRVTQICVSKLTTIGSDNGLSPGRRQAIIWTNAGILLIGPFGINLSELLIEINTVSFNKMYLKMSSAKWRLFRLGLNELMLLQHRSYFIQVQSFARKRPRATLWLLFHQCNEREVTDRSSYSRHSGGNEVMIRDGNHRKSYITMKCLDLK